MSPSSLSAKFFLGKALQIEHVNTDKKRVKIYIKDMEKLLYHQYLYCNLC